MTVASVKIKRNIEKRGGSFWALYLVLLCISGIFFTRFGVMDNALELVSVIATAVGTMMVLAWFVVNENDGTAVSILFCGYLMRVAYRFAVEIGLVPSAPADVLYFWEASSNLYHGIPAVIRSKYIYILKALYGVFGNNRYVAEYVNILFWVLSSVLLVKLGEKTELSGKRKYILYGIWSVLPASILFGTDLLRESIMVFFNMFSFYMFLGWMKSGSKFRFVMAFLLAAPSACLHTASIALWAAYVVIAMFYDTKTGKFKFMGKTLVLAAAGITGAGLILFSPLNSVFGAYIGSDLSLEAVTRVLHIPVIGGSDYLQWMNCRNWMEFIPYTVIRMFYFLFSPVPWEVRGIVDLFSFALDGLLVLVLLVYMGKHVRDNGKSPYLMAAFVCILAFTGIFAWGVKSAGTAIRHRMLVWGILIMGSCIAAGKQEKNLQQ